MEPKKVLIADDQRHPMMELKEALLEKGLNVIGEASNGKEVIKLNNSLKPDIIIMDIKMPEMTGIEASREITLKSPVPIILLTVKDDPETIERAKNAGVMGYMVKPFNKKELLPNIEIALSRFKEFQALKKENSNLRETLESRKIIEKAKGLLTKNSKISENEAFIKIRKMSMDKNIPMKDIARSIIMTFDL